MSVNILNKHGSSAPQPRNPVYSFRMGMSYRPRMVHVRPLPQDARRVTGSDGTRLNTPDPTAVALARAMNMSDAP